MLQKTPRIILGFINSKILGGCNCEYAFIKGGNSEKKSKNVGNVDIVLKRYFSMT